MSRSEFRFNKKRKHYAYLFKDIKNCRKNIVLSTKSTRIWKGKNKKNIKLYKHPNKNCPKEVYVIPVVYIDPMEVFDRHSLKWEFDRNDKRTIKRIKKGKIKK